MTTLDWSVIAAYFALLAGLTWWVVSRSRNTANDYFLAGRNLSWWVIGASLFASNIGSEHIVGLAGSGAADGVALAHYELHAWCLLVLAWAFVPFYMRSRVFTMPEFLERRFSPASRYVLSIVSIITFIVSKIAVGIFAGGVVFSGFTDGTLIAFDDTTMQQLWKINVGVGFNAPPMTFEVGGKQYVAILAGLSRIALAKHAFTPELKEQRNSPMLFVFGL